MRKLRPAAMIIAALTAGLSILLIAHTSGRLVYSELLVYLFPVVAAAAVAWGASRLFPSRRFFPGRLKKDLPLLVLFLASSAESVG